MKTVNRTNFRNFEYVRKVLTSIRQGSYEKVAVASFRRVFFSKMRLLRDELGAALPVKFHGEQSRLRKKPPDNIVKRVAVSGRNFDAPPTLSPRERTSERAGALRKRGRRTSHASCRPRGRRREEEEAAETMPESRRVTSREFRPQVYMSRSSGMFYARLR